MRRAPQEDEELVPRISPTHFTKETSAKELDKSTGVMQSILNFTSAWKIVGWALAGDVAPREMCPYVILVERDGERCWVHAINFTIQRIAAALRKDSSRIAQLR